MSTELVLRSSEVPAAFAQQIEMAKVLADSSLLPVYLRGKPSNVLIVLQGARALDVSAFWALQSMHVIEGKLSMAAELMRALVIRAGHKVRIVERTAKRAVVEIHRKDRDEPYRAEFTWEDAIAADLTKKTNWKAYPKSMMVARATAIAVRDECPDVMFGVVYTPDELGAVTDIDGAPALDADGRPLREGEVVEPLTDDEVFEIADALGNGELTDLPGVWQRVVDRAGVYATVPETDQSLRDYLLDRLAIEAQVLNTKPEARALWAVLNLMKVDNAATVTIDGAEWSLRAFVEQAAKALPEVAPAEPEADPADTPHAEAMREAAAASWDETELAKREQAFDRLAEHRREAAERLGRNLPPAEPPLEGEVVG